ncbi:MAG TPA: tyrosine-type recombinase/integrase [Streptosporangiaceae bacterium]
MTPAELDALTESWITHMQAERKSPHTIRTYTAGVAAFRRWCVAAGIEPVLDRATVEKFTAALLDQGAEAATALSRQRGVRRFSAWLAAEGEIPDDQLAGMRPPKLDDKVPAELTTDQVKAMLATCGAKDFHDIRDEAIIRLMTESMVRAGELLGMLTTEVDIRGGSALVRRGKGGKGRLVPFGPQTARALDRYARARRRHALAASPQFWLANRQRVMTYEALYSALRRRAERAGFTMHPHMLRATGAIRWRAAGGSVPGLLTVAGWSSLEMAQRYVKAAENHLAVDEAHKLNLGDL